MNLSYMTYQKRNDAGFARAALIAVPVLLSGCHDQAAPRMADTVVVPAVPSPESPARVPEPAPAPEPKAVLVPTTMTLLLAADTFLAYVSVPDGASVRDLEEPRSSFYYSVKGTGWSAIAGCERAFSCDVSRLTHSVQGGFDVKAEFSEQGYAPASAVYRFTSAAPGFLSP